MKIAINGTGDKEVMQNFARIETFLTENGHISDNVRALNNPKL